MDVVIACRIKGAAMLYRPVLRLHQGHGYGAVFDGKHGRAAVTSPGDKGEAQVRVIIDAVAMSMWGRGAEVRLLFEGIERRKARREM
jgi:hypothetical protein